MPNDSTLRDLEEYRRQHPEDSKLHQIIKAWTESHHPGMRAMQHPDTTHAKVVIEFRDGQLVWMKPEITMKIC
jgi:hypothetical protein